MVNDTALHHVNYQKLVEVKQKPKKELVKKEPVKQVVGDLDGDGIGYTAKDKSIAAKVLRKIIKKK